jgi:photosystem II stability/assembly factor-like uncharacterized protein
MRAQRIPNLAFSLIFGVTALVLSFPLTTASQSPEPENPHLEQEEGNRRREWNLEWYGEEWSKIYRDQLYEISESQRVKHPQTLQLAESMRRATDFPAAAPGSSWHNLGPLDGGSDFDVTEFGQHFPLKLDAVDSGRVSQIVPHPLDGDTLFVVSAEGGLWKTTDAGAHWAPLSEGEPSLSLGAMAIDPDTPSILYLGLGDIEEDSFGGTGTGILKSTDRGQTWTKLKGQEQTQSNLGTSRAVTSIQVKPKNGSLVLVGTDAGLFRSTDEGESYQQVKLPAGSPKVVRDITWIEGSQWVLAVGNRLTSPAQGGANILLSTNDGESWEAAKGLGPRAEILRFSLAAGGPNHRRRLYALASATNGSLFDIFKSTNGGVDWTATNARTIAYQNPIDLRPGLSTLLGTQGGYNQMAIVNPQDPEIAYFGGQFNIVRTTDGGATYSILSDWQGDHGLPYVHADFHCATFDAKGRLWVGNDGGLALSSSPDLGRNWSTAENRGLTTHLVYAVGSSPSSREVIIAGMQDNGTRVRLGNTTNFPQRIYADGFGVLAHLHKGDVLLGSAYYTRILKSTNGGESFKGSTAGISEANNDRAAPFFTKLIPSPADATGDTVYTFVDKKVYRSTNFGDSWTPIDIVGLAGKIRNFNVAQSDELSLALVSDDGSVFISRNGGRSWQTTTGSLPKSSARLSYVSFNPFDPQILYVASVAPNKKATHLWKTIDGGASWAAIDKAANFPRGAPVNIVVGDPGDADTIYAGTHLGLYKSTDGGENWTRFGKGLPLVSVTDIYISPDSSLVRVATFGRGIWELAE